MFSEETRFCLSLNEIKELGPVLIKRLLLKFSSAREVFNAGLKELASVEGIGYEMAKRIKEFNIWENIDKVLNLCKQRKIKIHSYLDEGPRKEHFPRRNRILSGMTVGTVVTEATINSGALITPSFALEQGREVFAVPGNITSKNFEGTNNLIQKGAKAVTKREDILEEIRQFISSLKESVNENFIYETVDLDEEERAIFNVLDEALNLDEILDEIVLKTNINIAKVLEILLKLEISGLINKIEGRYVRRI